MRFGDARLRRRRAAGGSVADPGDSCGAPRDASRSRPSQRHRQRLAASTTTRAASSRSTSRSSTRAGTTRRPPKQPPGRRATMFYDPRGQVVRTVNPDGSEQRVIYGVPTNLADPPLSPTGRPQVRAHALGSLHLRRQRQRRPHPSAREPHDQLPAPLQHAVQHRDRRPGPHRPGRSPPSRSRRLPAATCRRSRSTSPARPTTSRATCSAFAMRWAAWPSSTSTISPTARCEPRASMPAASEVLGCRRQPGREARHQGCARPACLRRPQPPDAPLGTRRSRRTSDAAGATALRRRPCRSRPRRGPQSARPTLAASRRSRASSASRATTSRDLVLESSRQVLSDDFMLGNFTAACRRHGLEAAGASRRLGQSRRPICSMAPTMKPVPPTTRWAGSNGPSTRRAPTASATACGQATTAPAPWSGRPARPARGQRRRHRRQTYVQRIAYNAKGQRTLIAYGNGLMTRYAYDPATFRLARLRTERLDPNPPIRWSAHLPAQGCTAAGHRVRLRPGWQHSLHARPHARLRCRQQSRSDVPGRRRCGSCSARAMRCCAVSTTTRSTASCPRPVVRARTSRPRPWSDDARDGYDSGNHGTPDQDNAPHLTALYREEYAYDAAGNMLTLRHNQSVQRVAARAGSWLVAPLRDGWTKPRDWRRESAAHLRGDWANPPSNRLTHVEDRMSGVPTSPSVPQSHFYDASGNMTREHRDAPFRVGSRGPHEGLPQPGRYGEADDLRAVPLRRRRPAGEEAGGQRQRLPYHHLSRLGLRASRRNTPGWTGRGRSRTARCT